jgi:hypothetical protein
MGEESLLLEVLTMETVCFEVTQQNVNEWVRKYSFVDYLGSKRVAILVSKGRKAKLYIDEISDSDLECTMYSAAIEEKPELVDEVVEQFLEMYNEVHKLRAKSSLTYQ